ncbi:unnamed protein product [Psylliodes chrysocephalus]|uniref:Mutator-like transposase domain-containing protein n=1 Tax=Psylliodes chrysocephalus TaxID=3402493 RepID=A0A9P0CIU6_9CUCU|nr:unnamed protein product [Psylliodes chrysocephala]
MGNKQKLKISSHRKNKTLIAKRSFLPDITTKGTETNINSSDIEKPCSSTSQVLHHSTTLHITNEFVEDIEHINSDVDSTVTPENKSKGIKRSLKHESSTLEGNRIVNIKHFFKEIVSFNHCGMFSCTPRELEIVHEIRKGFMSQIVIKCKMCRVKKTVTTSPDDGKLNTNQASVLGTISIGCGYSQMSEFFSTLDIPPLGYKLYKTEEKNLQQVIEQENWKVMMEAGAEEAKIARENGEVDENGIPQITVIADGAWCKRSYRSAYNAHSGAACIVGIGLVRQHLWKAISFLKVSNVV